MSFNEVETVFFQIPPETRKAGNWPRRTVMFMNECFDLDDVIHISPVSGYSGILHYYFTVEINNFKYEGSNLILRYDFANRGSAIKAHRQLSEAYTQTGKYAHVEEQGDKAVHP